MKKSNKLIDAIKASILCIKFPFLYPRNVFTDTHITRILGKYTYKFYQKAVVDIGITGKLEKDNIKTHYSSFENIFNIKVTLDKENRKIVVSNESQTKEYDLNKILWRDNNKFDILGISIVFALTGRPIIEVNVKTHDETDKTNYGFCYDSIKLIQNKNAYRKYKVLDWIDTKILDRILFIPTYTELDAMPEGWRNAFGIQMCEEIKQELKRHKGALKKYRIMQIKEKFGRLCWYDNGSPERVWKEIIPKYEKLSRTICINCGKPAEYISRGWISPYCSDCATDKEKYVKMTKDKAWDKALGFDSEEE